MWLFNPNIGRMKAKGDIPGLAKALGHKEQKIRSEAMEALVEIGEPAVETLTETLERAENDLRERAVRTLGKIGSAQAKESLVRALQDKYSNVREEAAEALGTCLDERLSDHLVQALRDSDWGVRNKAALALDELSWVPSDAAERAYYWIAKKEWAALAGLREAAVEPLIEALDLSEVTSDAALTLGKIRDPRAIEPLIRHMGKEMEIAAWASPVVQSLGGRLVVYTVTALVRLGRPAIEPLIQALGEEDAHTRSGAILALAGMGELAVGPLTRALGSDNELVRTSAAEALEQIGAAPGAKRVCPKCGSEMGPEKRFCTQCGTKLDSEG
jgi:HEAT repeat protein